MDDKITLTFNWCFNTAGLHVELITNYILYIPAVLGLRKLDSDFGFMKQELHFGLENCVNWK